MIIRIPILALALLAAPAAAAPCLVQPKATVPITIAGGVPTVPVRVNGLTATFILDTGAQRSVVSEAAVSRLSLARDPWVATTMSGIGGLDRRPNAVPDSLSLGDLALVRQTVSHDISLTVATLPQTRPNTPLIDGLLGRDYLSPFDLDLDLPAGSLTLYTVRNCAGRFLTWSGDYTAVPLTVPAAHALMASVSLDGTPLRALLDTGASASLLAAPGMYRMRLDAAALANDPTDAARGLGPREVPMRRHTFSVLRVGNQEIAAPAIWVAPLRLSPVADMLLGVDWLAGRRVWLSWATQQLFVASP